jgi:hypothetical protein
MEPQDLTEIKVAAHLQDIETARNDAEDLAWEHAKMAASAAGVALESQEFEFVFRELRTRYLVLADYLEYLTYNALLLARALLHNDMVTLNMDTPATDDDVALALGQIANRIVGSYAFLLAGEDLLWPRNGKMPDVGVPFLFPSDDIISTQE